MEQKEFETAVNQLAAAAELLASGVDEDLRMSAQQMRAFYRLQQGRSNEPGVRRTLDDELFKDTARAALTMAGRKEFLAAAALLEQACSLLRN